MTERRLVICFPGFEPLPVVAHCQRFLREARRTASAFGMTLSTTEPEFHRPSNHVETG
ncbi:MAG: hypothetical protein JNL61_20165, partial [Rhizobiaceae bacterium]|nr:hypothetical protein [Rhizobiaceae bacterium]